MFGAVLRAVVHTTRIRTCCGLCHLLSDLAEDAEGGCIPFRLVALCYTFPWANICHISLACRSSYYEERKVSRKSWGIDALGTVVVEVETMSGKKGVGISIGGEPACFIVEKHLARFVEGQDPHNVELIWE